MRTFVLRSLMFGLLAVLLCDAANAQSRRSVRGIDPDGTVLSVTASRENAAVPILAENLFLYENGIEQKIRNFAFDPTPAKILIVVDNSLTLPAATEKLQQAVMEFAYEIYDGDQIFVIAYDEKAEIIQEWTDDAKKIETSLATFRKKGNPYLFDALDVSVAEILLPLMPGTRKTAIVLIGDGLDRGSRTAFDKILARLQTQDIVVYALQVNDRTGGAFRRDQPKAGAVINQLAEGTGGLVFPLDDAKNAAKIICDELKKNRYLLSYMPANTSSFDARRILLTAEEGVTIRTKMMHPPNVK
ncbi:MAG: VWA domain-containing protein [Acidobacteriota bacterium]|nr:MAG: VWA domain-containing protein [Acidobacteriota bacterium]